MGPCLYEGMGEPSLIATLNAWGSARDREMLGLKADLGATQVGVSTAFEQAQETLLAIVAAFRAEAETMRQQTFYEAQQAIARPAHVAVSAPPNRDHEDTPHLAGRRHRPIAHTHT